MITYTNCTPLSSITIMYCPNTVTGFNFMWWRGIYFCGIWGGGGICVLGFVGGKSKSILEYKIILSGMFTNVVARWPGSTNDSHVFHTSSLCTYLETNNHSLDDRILLGDLGYASTPYLMTPYPSPSTAPSFGIIFLLI